MPTLTTLTTLTKKIVMSSFFLLQTNHLQIGLSPSWFSKLLSKVILSMWLILQSIELLYQCTYAHYKLFKVYSLQVHAVCAVSSVKYAIRSVQCAVFAVCSAAAANDESGMIPEGGSNGPTALH